MSEINDNGLYEDAITITDADGNVIELADVNSVNGKKLLLTKNLKLESLNEQILIELKKMNQALKIIIDDSDE